MVLSKASIQSYVLSADLIPLFEEFHSFVGIVPVLWPRGRGLTPTNDTVLCPLASVLTYCTGSTQDNIPT